MRHGERFVEAKAAGVAEGAERSALGRAREEGERAVLEEHDAALAGDGARLGDGLREADEVGDVDDAHVGRLRSFAQVVEVDAHVAADAVEDDAGAGGAHRFDLDAVVIGGHEDDAVSAAEPMLDRVVHAGARQVEALRVGRVETIERESCAARHLERRREQRRIERRQRRDKSGSAGAGRIVHG